MLGLTLRLGRANFNAQSAARAILRRHLERILHFLEFFPARRSRLESGRGVSEQCRLINLGANYGVRANQHALAALDTESFLPYRDFQRDIPFLPLRGGAGEGSI